jgi:2-dehydropantoate 2-reductase
MRQKRLRRIAPMSQPTVAIIGPGGVGSVFMTHLASTGIDILSCARRPFDRYVIETPEGDLSAAARVITDPAQLPPDQQPVDWLFIGLKAQQTQGAAAWFEKLSGPKTTIVTLQNGVEGEERMAPLANGAAVIPAVVYCAAELVAPGRVKHQGGARLIVPNNEPGTELKQLFGDSPANIKPADDHHDQAWYKLATNVVLNGITALTMRPMEVMRADGIHDLVRQLADEVFSVGIAEGTAHSQSDIDRFVESIVQLPDGGITSMLQDRRNANSTEAEAIHGAVSRLGQRHGTPTPVTTALLTLIKAGDPQ